MRARQAEPPARRGDPPRPEAKGASREGRLTECGAGRGRRLCFVVEWFDHNSSVTWTYQFMFYPKTGEIEMVRARAPALPAPCSSGPSPHRPPSPSVRWFFS